MWIRSQNKQTIQDVSNILIITTGSEFNLSSRIGVQRNIGWSWFRWWQSINMTSVILGTFLTKEAALVELDSIEKWIANGAQGVYQVNQP